MSRVKIDYRVIGDVIQITFMLTYFVKKVFRFRVIQQFNFTMKHIVRSQKNAISLNLNSMLQTRTRVFEHINLMPRTRIREFDRVGPGETVCLSAAAGQHIQST